MDDPDGVTNCHAGCRLAAFAYTLTQYHSEPEIKELLCPFTLEPTAGEPSSQMHLRSAICVWSHKPSRTRSRRITGTSPGTANRLPTPKRSWWGSIRASYPRGSRVRWRASLTKTDSRCCAPN